MARFVILTRDDGEQANTLFVCDSFRLPALIFQFFWLAWHRMWQETTLYFIAFIAINIASAYYSSTFGLLNYLLALFLALEGPNIHVKALQRKGYAIEGVVYGDHQEEIAYRWFDEMNDHDKAQSDKQPPLSGPRPHSVSSRPAKSGLTPSGPALGMFEYPG